MEYLYTARKYMAANFENSIVMYLNSTLEPGHVFEVLNMADFYILPQLSAFVWKYIETNAREVLEENFLNFDHNTLVKVLKNQKLVIMESRLFTLSLE